MVEIGIIEKCPAKINCKCSYNKRSILKPMYSSFIYTIFVEIKMNNRLYCLNSHNFKLDQLSPQFIEMVNGKKSFRFEVNHGECGQEPKFSDCENERERSELYYSFIALNYTQ